MEQINLTLKRVALRDNYTIGKLYINNDYFCDTLEDKVRDKNKDGDLNDEGETKVWGETAIPYGVYTVKLSYSPKFKRILPRLFNVPHFEGILIHSGNTAKDSHGCILVGQNKVVGKVINSTATLNLLISELEDSKQKEWKLSIE